MQLELVHKGPVSRGNIGIPKPRVSMHVLSELAALLTVSHRALSFVELKQSATTLKKTACDRYELEHGKGGTLL